MKNNFYKLKALIFIILLLSISCTKEGPPGPAGPQGDPGQKGDKGDVGPQGADGNFNVIVSPWMDFNWNVNNEPNFKQMLLQVPEITEDFVNSGGVALVYYKRSFETITAIVQLPYLINYYRLMSGVIIIPQGKPPIGSFTNGIAIIYEAPGSETELEDLQDSLYENHDFRYVLIPGSLNTLGNERWAEPRYDYETIKARFNIPD